jgi:hypothetical protein
MKDVIEKTNPQVVYPIHTEHPEMFKDLVKNLNVECPEIERRYEF